MDTNTIRFLIFIGVFLLMLFLEWRIPRHPTVDSKPRRIGVNLSIIGINVITVRLLFGGAAAGAAVSARAQGWGLFNTLALPAPAEDLCAAVFLDFMIYLQHVAAHKIPLLWRLHMAHHSDLDLDVSSGLRFHPLEIIVSMLYKIGLVLALGASPRAVLIFEAVLNGMAQFNHSNIRLPDGIDRVLRLALVTPDMHRIHHSVEVAETNSNYGFNFSLWDRFLGTYRAAATRPQAEIVIGLRELRQPAEVSLWNLLRMPFKPYPATFTNFS